MSTVTRENIGVLTDKITVKLAKDDYLPSFEKALKDYSKKANIPGFRKGMVPAGLIKKMYGHSVFTDEVLRSVEKELTNYMVNEKLDIFAQPLPLPENDVRQIDMGRPEEYSFAFEVGLKPSFSLPDLSLMTPDFYQIQVTEEMIDSEQERLLVRNGKMTEPEKIEKDDNVLNLTFTESDAEGTMLEGALSKDNSLLLKYFRPDFQSKWMEKKKGDSINVVLADAFEEKELSWILGDLGLEANEDNKQKHFNITITKIGLVEKPTLDEAFFTSVFPGKEIKTTEDFRAALKGDIKKQLDNQTRSQLQHTLYHELLGATKIPFPDPFLKKWLRSGGEKPKTEEEVEQEFPTFSDQLKWTLILDRVVQEQKLEVTADDLRALAKQQLLGYLGMGFSDEEQPWMADYMNRMMQDKKFVEDSVHRIRTDKVLDWAETQVKPVKKEIAQEDFAKMQDEHQHHHH